MQEPNFRELLKKYSEGQCTEQEKAMLETWYLTLAEEGDRPSAENIQQAFGEVRSALPGRSASRKHLWKRVSTAAAVSIFAAVALYFYQANTQPSENTAPIVAKSEEPAPVDAMPGGNRALLILSDGSSIDLDDADKGELAKQGETGIQKTGQGQLLYASATEKSDPKTILYNTIATPRGGQYQVTLPDGTRVWLNAASSLRFPTAFAGDNRVVTLSGEAYFEVAPDKSKPFLVDVNKSQVEVLGTHFNIMSYEDEVLTTTLLEGSVKFRHGGSEQTIEPGQAARLLGTIRVGEANTADAVAWKNGVTAFSNADIYSIMRQISRWYDLDIVYKGNMPERKFTGKIPRTAKLSKVLKVLELSDINFKIEDKTIIVTP